MRRCGTWSSNTKAPTKPSPSCSASPSAPDAQAAGAPEQQLRNIAAEGLQEIYFKDRGRRADGLLVEFTDIDYVELDF
ncbi:hypothetical protein HEK616_83350 (plasmid) [Streptomyces nigrescens]|uniref:Uncharacterized protein n=1 Tax=Streptomyces nigrescens TaxID=1920 RepID=A0ABN6R912_STRNI|nr:hypothetical protein HEK616_83350 [Streptomyces nigrescens]